MSEKPRPMMEEYETCGNDDPICPWCGHVDYDAWDHDWHRHEDLETDCGSCSKPMFLSRHMTITYSTKRVEVAETGNPGAE